MEDLHKSLGCYTCYYADEDALGKGPCCTFGGKPPLADIKTGKCNKHRWVCPKCNDDCSGECFTTNNPDYL